MAGKLAARVALFGRRMKRAVLDVAELALEQLETRVGLFERCVPPPFFRRIIVNFFKAAFGDVFTNCVNRRLRLRRNTSPIRFQSTRERQRSGERQKNQWTRKVRTGKG